MLKIEKSAPAQKKQSKLETANEMYKMAFQVKKFQFAKKNPLLSEADLQKMTAQYFQNIRKD